MHWLMKCIFDASQDPAQYVDTMFVFNITENREQRRFLKVHMEELEERKEVVGAKMRRIQDASREVNVQRMEVLEARKKLLYGGT